MGASMSAADQQGLIIGLTVGLVALLIVFFVVCICCCCRKAERSWLKRKFKRDDRRFTEQRNDMTADQARRREELEKRHAEIRNKYGLPSSTSSTSTSTNPFEQSNVKTSYGVGSDEINVSIR